ncbi:hypothetical protein VTK73DRAFT_8913 [Phialemonium thermophilum]|uniref:Uncharacterized protein n=1 Tax=Phialemonium thermophilum TaxID=223376 RepID=A0ABR3W5K5_9PEZI
MTGLIPLMLKPASATPGNRSSIAWQPTHSRQHSLSYVPTARPKAVKRLSQPVLPTTLPSLPQTDAEWRRLIVEIKGQHVKGRYRACSTRCAEILGAIGDPSRVEPTYLLSLHLYAAASMEMCTRPLPLTSPYRTSLLRQARGHYEQAASLAQAAEDSVVAKARSSCASSVRSSCHSPAGSISSQTWTADTSFSSPTNSVCSFDDLAGKAAQTSPASKRPVKKVSFSLPDSCNDDCEAKTPPLRMLREPAIRPDSPTLGFDDEYFHAGAALRDLPDPPKPKGAMRPSSDMPLGLETNLDRLTVDTPYSSSPRSSIALPFSPNLPPHNPLERSVLKYSEHLASLRAQLTGHMASLDSLLSDSKPGAADMILLAEGRRAQEGYEDVLYPRPESASGTDLRELDKRARIERLRKNGWQRKRFDPSRYEVLCDAVMAELG